MYKIKYHRKVIKEIQRLKEINLDIKAKKLIDLIKENPYQIPPPYEKLVGDLQNYYSRRINIKHRLVYQVYEKENTIKIISLWSHYENI